MLCCAVAPNAHVVARNTDVEDTGRAGLRLGFFAHEVRNLTNTAILALEVLRTGHDTVSGTAGATLHRSLAALRTLVGQSLCETRLTEDLQHRETVLVSEFIRDVASAAILDADARGLGLVVASVDETVAVTVDRQVLSAAVVNLLQNAFKFTRPGTTVTLGVEADAERVRIEVQDECGGLPCEDSLFRPLEQHGGDRTGLGLGLAFSRWAVEASQGRISARNVPERGCVFTVDLPRTPVAARGITHGIT